MLLLTGFVYWLLYQVAKDAIYAAYAVSWILLWFGLFGHLYQAVNLAFVALGRTGNENATLIVWSLVMFLLGIPPAWKRIRNKKLVNDLLTAFAVGAAVVPIITTANALYSNQSDLNVVNKWQSEQPPIQLTSEAGTPDIYYIILDGYGRADILNELYGFDNSEFLSALEDRGFFIAGESHSNYMQTSLSLASTLNLDYMNFLSIVKKENRAPAYELINSSRMQAVLEQSGYETVNIASPVLFTQLRDFDTFLSPGKGSISEFEKLLISISSTGPLVKDSDILIPGYQSHRVYTLHSFDKLGAVAAAGGRKFVFTHVVGPHPPFVFDAEGDPVQSDQPYVMSDASGFPGTINEYKQGYISEMQYINALTLKAVDEILKNSATLPIIIIQGDHGPGAYTNLFLIEKSCLRERGSILNAYFFPDQNYTALPQDITPVNTFRIILNQFFGADLPLLKNRIYFSYWDDPYNFVDVTDRLDEACQP
jgi:hypothetical protein